jgi:EpsI family protein
MSYWKRNKNPALLCLILLLGAAHNLYGLENRQKAPMKGLFPTNSFSQWSSKPLETSIYEKDLLSSGKIDKRVYFSNKDFIWYVLIESLKGHHGQHQPEVCYTGNGWAIEKRDSTIIQGNYGPIKATKILLHRGEEYRWAVYWYSNGNMTTGNFYERVFQHVRDDWSNKSYSAWTFHRVSTPVMEDVNQSLQTIKTFIQEIKFSQKGNIL